MKLIIILLLSISLAKSAEIATVLKSKGTVYKAFSDKKPLIKGANLKRKDVIITEKASFIRIRMLDDTVITLGPNSSLLLQRFRFTTKEKRAFSIKLLRGKLRANIVNKSKKDSLKFETNTVSLGVRGTELLINAGEVTKVAVISGKIALFNKLDDTVKELVAGAQFISIINTDKSLYNSKFLRLEDKSFKALAANSMKLVPSSDGFALGSSGERPSSRSQKPPSSRSQKPPSKSKDSPLNENLFLDDSADISPRLNLEERKRNLFK